MMIFGKFLLQKGVLTRPQLDEATQSQVVFGGRLGTNLVELGYLRLDDLERHLAEHLGIPTAPSEWTLHPAVAALKTVPADLVERHRILPLALEERTLHLAMMDPRNPDQVDDIGFATGLRVQPYVMSELRLSALMEHHYGIPRDTRYINLGREVAHGRHAPEDPAGEGEAPVPVPEAPTARSELGIDPLAAGQELIDEATFSSLHESWQGVAEAEPGESPEPVAAEPEREEERGAAVDVAALEEELAAARDRDSVCDLALRIACHHASASALFVVRGGMVSGFLGDGEGAEENLEGVLIPADADTIFAGPAAARTPYRGRPPEEGLNGRVLAALSRRGVRDAVVIPITIRDRVINLLYADNGSEPFADTSLAALGALCGCVATAYERLILERKGRFA
jgi:hypothetical protein